jgi:hypothetical protein
VASHCQNQQTAITEGGTAQRIKDGGSFKNSPKELPQTFPIDRSQDKHN